MSVATEVRVTELRSDAERGLPYRLPRLSSVSLFWRVFVINALLMTAAVVLLAVTPLTVSDPATTRQLLYLAVGLIAVLVANVALLRVSLLPLQRLIRLTRRIDLLQPGERLEVAGARELNVVSAAFNEMLDRLERERQMSSSRAVRREEAERRRLASELHDQVGQGMTALLLELKTAVDRLPPTVRPQLLEAQAIARDNLEEVRRIARRLRPTVLDDLGLAYALQALADAADEQTEASIMRRIDTETPRVSDAAELVLYRIAQEALANAIRHSGASRIELVLQASEDDRVLLSIHDDGRGMLYATGVEGGGIRGMRERALTIAAELQIVSRTGRGTSITVTLPVDGTGR